MLGTSLVDQWWRFCLSAQGVWVEFLVRELRSHEAKSLFSLQVVETSALGIGLGTLVEGAPQIFFE